MRALIALILFCGALSGVDYSSAHVLYFCEEGGREVLLMGLTSEGKLSTFGGMRERGEEDPRETAARELEEEALGVLGLRGDVVPNLKFYALEKSPNYILRSKVDPHTAILAYRAKRAGSLTAVQKEMIDIVAVDVDSLRAQIRLGLPLLFPDNQGFLRPFRLPVAKMALKTYR